MSVLPSGAPARTSRAVALAAIFLASAGMATSLFFLSLDLQQEHGLTPLQTSATLLPYGVVLIATGAVAGRLSTRFGPGALLAGGLLLAAAAAVLTVFSLSSAALQRSHLRK